jgi:hypothetical protein
MPFCVSSFSALIKGQGYILILPSRPLELHLSLALCAVFVIIVLAVKRFSARRSNLTAGAARDSPIR